MSNPRLRFCLALHNHQPVGNFDSVIQQAFLDSYLPFLETFEAYSSLAISLHISGPLMLWLEQNQSEYLRRLGALVSQGRVEILGGAFYEPILSMIPARDRRGQIRNYSRWLGKRFDATVRGMWIPERVWEASLVSDVAESEIEYTVLDDYHFRCAGLGDEQLHGYYVTEDQGNVLRVFPGSEQLRYMIPFREPQETIDYLRYISELHPGTTVVFADDGEKFGTWPETHKHVYEDCWLSRFFDALVAHGDWLQCTTLSQVLLDSPPQDKIFLPAASYREMTEWALPVERQLEFGHVAKEMQSDGRWPQIQQFVRGGFWRNFRNKYPETDEMYARMMHVSDRLQSAIDAHGQSEALEQARDHLYRSQCNCAWWHGAFGGVYLPHLRNAVYHHLIQADNLIDQQTARTESASIEAADFNFDLATEVRMANPNLIGWFSPASGGHLYELDVRPVHHNLLATMQRRPEAYHETVRSGAGAAADEAASIHNRVVFKQADLQQNLIYDSMPRKSLIDHFWPTDCPLADIQSGAAPELGDFATGRYESKLRRSAERNQLLMTRSGFVGDYEIQITKGVTLGRDSDTLEMAWLLEGLPEDQPLRFGIEFNFAGMPANEANRFFSDSEGQQLGLLDDVLDIAECSGLTLTDQWLGLDARLTWDVAGNVWTFPIATVSQSEGGFELVHQSVVVQPVWLARGDANGRWAVKLELQLATETARERIADQPAANSRPDPKPIG